MDKWTNVQVRMLEQMQQSLGECKYLVRTAALRSLENASELEYRIDAAYNLCTRELEARSQAGKEEATDAR